jgi:phosphoribosylformylglycinamidine synthase subunit PurS
VKFKATIDVRLRKDHQDPESETIKKSLQDLNFAVAGVRVAKVYEIIIESSSKKDAEATVKAMCSRLLVNPTKDEFEFEVVPVGNAKPRA